MNCKMFDNFEVVQNLKILSAVSSSSSLEAFQTESFGCTFCSTKGFALKVFNEDRKMLASLNVIFKQNLASFVFRPSRKKFFHAILSQIMYCASKS